MKELLDPTVPRSRRSKPGGGVNGKPEKKEQGGWSLLPTIEESC